MLNIRHKTNLRVAAVMPALFSMLAPTAEAQDDAAMELGRKVFTEIAEPPCGVCHTLEAAGTEGKVGPPLDELKPSQEKVELAVRGGTGVMPAFEEILSEEQIMAVSQYVAKVAGNAE